MNITTGTDVLALRREYAWEAIDGAMTQFAAAGRFLTRGEDQYATAAFQRGIDFIKLAAPEVRSLTPADSSGVRDNGEAA